MRARGSLTRHIVGELALSGAVGHQQPSGLGLVLVGGPFGMLSVGLICVLEGACRIKGALRLIRTFSGLRLNEALIPVSGLFPFAPPALTFTFPFFSAWTSSSTGMGPLAPLVFIIFFIIKPHLLSSL